MAERDVRPSGARQPDRQRIKKLAQAALNADVTVDQLDSILGGLGEALEGINSTMDGMNTTIERLDVTLTRFSGTLDQVDEMADRMLEVVARLERVTSRVEILVGIGEVAMRPLNALESAGRSVAARLGFS